MIKWNGWRKIDFDGSFVILGAIVLLCVAIYATPRGRAIKVVRDTPVMTEGEFRLALIEEVRNLRHSIENLDGSVNQLPDYVFDVIDENLNGMMWKGVR